MRQRWAMWGWAVAALLGGLGWAAQADAAGRVGAAVDAQLARAGQARVMVVFEPSATAQARTRHRQAADDVLARLPARGVRVARRFEGVDALALEIDARALQRLRTDPAVRRIDLDEGGMGHGVAPDEASFLNRVAPLQPWGLDGAGMKVAVIDTGVDTDHVDFAGRIAGEQCFCSVDGACCPNGQATQSGAGSAEDDHGHGTHVAGIMVGAGTAAPRGALPAATLVAVKVMNRFNRFCCTSDLVGALDWVATHHPDVDAVNMSLGTISTLYEGHCDSANAFTQAMTTAINRLVSLGAVVTVSAGNQADPQRMAAPACVSSAVSVGATWDFDGPPTTYLGCTDPAPAPRRPTCFSNRSMTTDLFAAGAFVNSTWINGVDGEIGGTSMAAPMTGACAVAIKQAAPASTVAQRIEAMTLSGTRITDPVSGRTYPHLDCVDAVALLNPAAVAPVAVNGSAPRLPPETVPAAPAPAQVTGVAGSQPARTPRVRDDARRRASPTR